MSELNNAGRDLVHYAQNSPTSARGVVTELFPYIFEASQRMSSRAIAAYLNETHKIGISASTVTRAIRNSDEYLDLYLDEVEPALQVVKTALGLKNPHTMLLVHEDFIAATHHEPTFRTLEFPADQIAMENYKRAIRTLEENWWVGGEKFREAAYQRLRERDTEEDDQEQLEPIDS